MRTVVVALLLVVIAAGCVSPGMDGISINHDESSDISDMAQVSIYYQPPRAVEPGEDFSIKLKAENLHKRVDLENFVCNINDDSIFSLNTPAYQPETLFRKSSRIYTYELHVPSDSIVVNNINTKIGYKCTYSHIAKSTLVYSIYDKRAYNDYIDQGKSLSAYTSSSSGEGPLVIDMKMGDSDVVRQGTSDILSVQLKNTGSKGFVGTVNGFRNYLPAGSLEIWIESAPLKSCSIESLDKGMMSCSQDMREGKQYCKCINAKDIQLLDSQSEPMQLRMDFKDGVTDESKQFSVLGFASYNYIFEGTVAVEVKAR